MLIYVHNNLRQQFKGVADSWRRTNCVLHKFREDNISNSSTLVVSIPPAETVPCIFLHFSGVSMYYSLRIKIVSTKKCFLIIIICLPLFYDYFLLH